MSSDVVWLDEADRTQVALVGGKGARLAELRRIDGVRVPDGFCVTTAAFGRIVGPSIAGHLDRLSALRPEDDDARRALAAETREVVEGCRLPADVVDAMADALARLGGGPVAVRSSATTEDLPSASFAGQHDTYLGVIGPDAIVAHVRRCWASLFTERAVAARVRRNLDHRHVRMAVVVQRMVAPDASGVAFTADPVTSHRSVTAIEAVFGLGEALVSGRAPADAYRVRDGALVERTIATKPTGEFVTAGGGTERRAIAPDRRDAPVLTDDQAVELAALARRIEAHAGRPQDVEWCLVDGAFVIVQSRPITTLYPVPGVDDGAFHVYVSVGHQQMMTDPIRPLGLSFWQLTALPPMHAAGGRLFVDVAPRLASPSMREAVVAMLGKGDPLIGDALRTIVERGDVPTVADDGPAGPPPGLPGAGAPPIATDPALVEELIAVNEASVEAAAGTLAPLRGEALLDAVLADIAELRRVLFDPRSMQAIMAGMEATWWLNDRLAEWLGETNAADAFTRSLPRNVTAEMGLALLDVADAVRPHPDVVAYLERVEVDAGPDALDGLAHVAGGPVALDAIGGFLRTYGVRCVGEIDITRPRWSERPGALVPALLGNVRHAAPGEAARRFSRGRDEAERAERDVLARLRRLPDGEARADETARMIARVRTFGGYREYPKFGIVRRYALYRRALLAEAERLVRAGVLHEPDDLWFLTFDEVHTAVRTAHVDHEAVRTRRRAFAEYHALTPPRVITSDGEVVTGSYRRADAPAGALVGLGVSAGVVEGRARVVFDMADAALEPGDILVTTSTDPSWTPLFVAAAGLVTEVGGLMTHGAVIAREYGLPAVVGVEHATARIRDGQRLRVHGRDGHVEILG